MIPSSLIPSRHGPLRVIDGDGVISDALRRYGEWAWLELKFLAKLMGEGDVVADVGAFIGSHSRAFSHFVGPAGLVYAFEPRESVHCLLEENARSAPAGNIRAFRCALGSAATSCAVSQQVVDGNWGACSLLGPGAAGGPAQVVEIRRLDEWALQRLDLVKIDVEGMERHVLDGGQETIGRCRPLIYAEVNSLNNGIPLLDWSRMNQYAMYCAIHPAYNPENFLHNPDNCFGIAAEIGALLLPVEKISGIEACLSGEAIIPIVTADDLANVLLHKPQYFGEVLLPSASSVVLDPGSAALPIQRGLGAASVDIRVDAALHARVVELERSLAVLRVTSMEAAQRVGDLEGGPNGQRHERLVGELELAALSSNPCVRFMRWLGWRKP